MIHIYTLIYKYIPFVYNCAEIDFCCLKDMTPNLNDFRAGVLVRFFSSTQHYVYVCTIITK